MCAEASTSGQTPACQLLAPSTCRKVPGLRRRQASPQCARNIFLHGPPDADTICRVPKLPPFVRRYRFVSCLLLTAKACKVSLSLRGISKVTVPMPQD